jgi:hypothetical protein
MVYLNNDLGYEPDANLLFLIISRSNEFDIDLPASSSGYMKRFEREIRATCRVLEWLNLARPDKASPLGCTPSHQLMYVLAEPTRGRLTSAKEAPTTDDEDVIESIFEAALSDLKYYDLGNARLFGLSVLSALGLLRTTKNGDYTPTGHLRELAAERRQEDRRLREEQQDGDPEMDYHLA